MGRNERLQAIRRTMTSNQSTIGASRKTGGNAVSGSATFGRSARQDAAQRVFGTRRDVSPVPTVRRAQNAANAADYIFGIAYLGDWHIQIVFSGDWHVQ